MFASSTRLLRTAASRRLIHSTPATFAASGKDPQLSQGLSGPKSGTKNRSPQDVQSQSAESGHQARASDSPQDAASGAPISGGAGRTRGNPEGIGAQEQVGGASASAQNPSSSAGEMGGKEEASAPGYVGKVKQALGLSDSGDVKRDDRRGFHTSAVARTRADPKAAREPKEPGLHGEQNEHLKHKRDGSKPDSGEGNASSQPTLPSQKTPQTRANAPAVPPKKRGLHTSASVSAQQTMGHPSADPEQQSVGEVRQPSATTSTGGVSGAVTLAELEEWRKVAERQPQSTRFPPPTRRPKHSFGTGSTSGRAEMHTSAVVRASGQHNADSYFKDVDTAPSESGGVHKVDSSNDALDQPSQGGKSTGPYHQAGVGSDEYKNVSKDAPYNEPGADQKENLRYGGTPKLGSERSGNNPGPKSEESPSEGNKGGRGA